MRRLGLFPYSPKIHTRHWSSGRELLKAIIPNRKRTRKPAKL